MPQPAAIVTRLTAPGVKPCSLAMRGSAGPAAVCAAAQAKLKPIT
jgi:hypothetical protein